MEAPQNLPQATGNGVIRPQAHSIIVPVLIAAAGEDAARHYINFFIASIRNRHTRRSYARQAEMFLSWCQARGLADVRQVHTEHVAAYIETMSRSPLETARVTSPAVV